MELFLKSKKLVVKTIRYLRYFYHIIKYKNSQKVFLIGRNKTGTTSMRILMRKLGYKDGDQRIAEWLQNPFLKGNYKPLFRYINSAEFFQDYPFSYPPTYRILSKKYPTAKFILTERDSSKIWFDSLKRFHSKGFNFSGNVTWNDIKNVSYVKKGWMYKNWEYLGFTNSRHPYDEELYRKHYECYNNDVKEFFGNSKNFIAINLNKSIDVVRLSEFLNVPISNFPHLNKSKS